MPERKKEHELMLSKQCKLHLEQEGQASHMRRALRIAVKLQLL